MTFYDRPMQRLLSITALTACLWMTAACSTNPATGQQSFTAFMSAEDELRVGAEEHPKILKDMGGEYMDPAIQTYVDWVGEKLAKVSDLPELKFKFTVLNDAKINAFALPGGYVYITRGLVALAENEAEMAGVLAHEVGHITARHTAQRYSTAMATNLGLLGLGIAGSIFGVPGDVNRLAGQVGQLYLQSYSREQELESDMLAVRYMSRAGYDPKTLETFFRKMRQHTSISQRAQGKPDEDPADSILSTHPRTADRIAQAIRLARAKPVANPRVGRDDFLSRIDGMAWGDSPDQGIVKGRIFEHPELKFRFEVPPGFWILNSPKQIMSRGPNGAVIIFNLLNEKKARQVRRVSDHVSSWANSRLNNVEPIDVNGMEAATGVAQIDTSEGQRDLRLVAIREAPGRIYRFLFLTKPGTGARLSKDLRRTTYSFRRLSDAEVSKIKPLKLRVITVNPGDTPQSLASLMPLEKFSLDWFLTLNGMTSGQSLKAGQRVKIVTP